MINKTKADLIAAQALKEIEQDRFHKNGKITGWQKNEAMYYGVKSATEESRANVSLGQMQEFVHTLLSKIDNPMTFKFTKRKPSQLKRVALLNSLKNTDADNGFWNLKDIVGKKQAIIYGRAIYAYYASSTDGKYESHLEPVDAYDFLIDPSVSGIDMETAQNMGRWGIIKTKAQLKQGVKNKIYNKDAVNRLFEGVGNNTIETPEETNKRSRSYDVKTLNKKEQQTTNKFKFWEWCTTYDGERYYILMDNSGTWIRCELLIDMFTSNLWPFWSWACFPDLTEFWTPGYCDYIREILMAQEVAINQTLDNGEAINKPQKAVQVEAIADMSKLVKYRKDGIIPVKKGFDVEKAIQVLKTPSINTSLLLFDKLQSIKDRATGVTDGSAGVADEAGKVGIYEGNQQAAADRFGLLNKSYSFGYKQFAKLYEWGVKDHLTKKVAIDILGPNGVEIKSINKRDIYKRGDEFGLIVESSDAEFSNAIKNQTTKIAFLTKQANNQSVNQQKMFELEAKIAGFNEDEIREMLDVNTFGNEELMSEADRDIESLLNNEKIEPNELANNAYKQKMVNYMRDHKEDINFEQFTRIAQYIESLEDIIMRNEARALQNELTDQLNAQTSLPLENNVPTPAITEPGQ